MAESFDPYHVWLGIPPEDQPPNHYRLLGIRPFEANPDVIDNAADQRMTHLRTFQTGKNAKLSQKLLNDVSAARLCLLHAPSKSDYDRKLKASLPPPAGSGISLASQSGIKTASPSAISQAAAQSGKSAAASNSGLASTAKPSNGGAAGGPPPVPVSREAMRRQAAGMPVAQAMGASSSAPPRSAAAPLAPTTAVNRPQPKKKNLAGPLIGGGIALVALVGLGVGYAMMKQAENGESPSKPGGDAAAATTTSAAVAVQPVQPVKPVEQPKNDPNAPATLVFNTGAPNPAGLSILVDDRPIPAGQGDVWEFPLPPGQHQVHAIRSGFKPFDATVVAAAGQRLPIDLKWQQLSILRFQWPVADREGATLMIDGQRQPLTATELEFQLLPGVHQVRIVRRGFVVQSKAIDVTTPGVTAFVPEWKPVPVVAQNLPAAKEGRPVDLLALADPQGERVRGEWRKENGALISDKSHPAIMPIPITPHGDYRITMVCERTDGFDSMAMGLVYDGNIFTAGVDSFPDRGGFAGVEVVDGQRVNETPFRKTGRFITNNKPTTLVFTVLKNHFWLTQDGQVLVDWPNSDYRRCTLFNFYKGVDETKPFVTTWSSVYRITRLTLTPLNEGAAAVAQNPTKLPNLVGNDPAAKPVEKPAVKEPKVAVPDAAAQAAATKTVQGVYRDDLKRATAPEQKIELARKLHTDGLGTADDPVGRYVLLKMARDLAASTGDLETAGEVLDDMAERYEMDGLEAKADMLIAASKTPLHSEDVSTRLNALADDAVAVDRYDLAKKLLTAGLTLKDSALRKQTIIHQKEIGETETEFHKLKAAIDTLKTSPDDPAANLAVGKFNCLVKGNFEVGLPLLAKGNDKALADLAKLELAQSADSAEQIKVADSWWDTGKRAARLHAKSIYETILPSLNGISRVRIEKRLQELEAKPGGESWTNLLKLIDPDKNAVRGKWTKSSEGLQCTTPAFGALAAVPFEPAANYLIRAEVTRLSGNNEVMLVLPVAGSEVRVALGVNEKWGGIDRINNQMIYANGPLARPAPVENNKRYVIEVSVRTGQAGADPTSQPVEILVRVNGSDFTSFQGLASQLTGLPYGWRLANPKNPAIGCSNSTAVFHSLQYRKLSAKSGK